MIRFKDQEYYYSGRYMQNENPNTYRLDSDSLQMLIDQRRYQEAIDYAKNYHFDDIFKEQEWKSFISQIKDKAKEDAYLYGDLAKDSPELQAIDFTTNILKPGGWKLIDNNNKYKQHFTDIKRNLGNTSLGAATSLEVEFAPKKQYDNFFGFNVDVLARDNNINIDNFYKYTGLSKEELTEAGIAPREKDGRTVITFSKDNDLSNRILYGLGALLANEEGKYFNLIGYDADGNRLDKEQDQIKSALQTTESLPALPKIGPDGESVLYDEHGKLNRGLTTSFRDWTVVGKNNLKDWAAKLDPIEYTNMPNYRQTLEDLYSSIDVGTKVRQKLVNDLRDKKEELTAQYPTTIFGFVSDQVQQEFEMMNHQQLEREQFNVNAREYEKVYANQLAGLGESNYEFYSNWNDPKGNLKPLDSEEKREIMNHVLAAYKADRVKLQVAESGGKLGAYISIIPLEKEKKTGYTQEQDKERIHIFIPGLWSSKAQERINNNTTYKARKEVQDMELLGYEYKTEDGNTISVKAYNTKGEEVSFKNKDSLNRQFFVTDKNGVTRPVDKAEALTRIDKSLIMESGVEEYVRRYANLYGKITNIDEIEPQLRKFATDAVNSLYPHLIELSKEDIFDNPVVRDKSGRIVIDGLADKTDADDELSWQAFQKTKEAFDIYNYILNNLIYLR